MTMFRLALIAALLTGCSDDATSDSQVDTSTTTDAAADAAAAADTSAAPDAVDASAPPDVPDVAADVNDGGDVIAGEVERCARQTAALTGSAETDYRAFLCYDPAPRTCSIVSGQAQGGLCMQRFIGYWSRTESESPPRHDLVVYGWGSTIESSSHGSIVGDGLLEDIPLDTDVTVIIATDPQMSAPARLRVPFTMTGDTVTAGPVVDL